MTATATRVGPQPTPFEISSDSVTAWKIPAAVSAGIARKNDIRVTVTRSRPRNRPAAIVAPERETPGISATHWISAHDQRVAHVEVAPRRASLRSRATRSAAYMTKLQTISAAPTTQRLRSGPSITSRSASPAIAIGIEPTATASPKRKSRVVALVGVEDPADERGDDPQSSPQK